MKPGHPPIELQPLRNPGALNDNDAKALVSSNLVVSQPASRFVPLLVREDIHAKYQQKIMELFRLKMTDRNQIWDELGKIYLHEKGVFCAKNLAYARELLLPVSLEQKEIKKSTAEQKQSAAAVSPLNKGQDSKDTTEQKKSKANVDLTQQNDPAVAIKDPLLDFLDHSQDQSALFSAPESTKKLKFLFWCPPQELEPECLLEAEMKAMLEVFLVYCSVNASNIPPHIHAQFNLVRPQLSVCSDESFVAQISTVKPDMTAEELQAVAIIAPEKLPPVISECIRRNLECNFDPFRVTLAAKDIQELRELTQMSSRTISGRAYEVLWQFKSQLTNNLDQQLLNELHQELTRDRLMWRAFYLLAHYAIPIQLNSIPRLIKLCEELKKDDDSYNKQRMRLCLFRKLNCHLPAEGIRMLLEDSIDKAKYSSGAKCDDILIYIAIHGSPEQRQQIIAGIKKHLYLKQTPGHVYNVETYARQILAFIFQERPTKELKEVLAVLLEDVLTHSVMSSAAVEAVVILAPVLEQNFISEEVLGCLIENRVANYDFNTIEKLGLTLPASQGVIVFARLCRKMEEVQQSLVEKPETSFVEDLWRSQTYLLLKIADILLKLGKKMEDRDSRVALKNTLAGNKLFADQVSHLCTALEAKDEAVYFPVGQALANLFNVIEFLGLQISVINAIINKMNGYSGPVTCAIDSLLKLLVKFNPVIAQNNDLTTRVVESALTLVDCSTKARGNVYFPPMSMLSDFASTIVLSKPLVTKSINTLCRSLSLKEQPNYAILDCLVEIVKQSSIEKRGKYIFHILGCLSGAHAHFKDFIAPILQADPCNATMLFYGVVDSWFELTRKEMHAVKGNPKYKEKDLRIILKQLLDVEKEVFGYAQVVAQYVCPDAVEIVVRYCM